MADKVRIGFVGAGGIAKAHVDALSKVPDAEMDRLTDSDEPCADGTTPKKFRH